MEIPGSFGNRSYKPTVWLYNPLDCFKEEKQMCKFREEELDFIQRVKKHNRLFLLGSIFQYTEVILTI